MSARGRVRGMAVRGCWSTVCCTGVTVIWAVRGDDPAHTGAGDLGTKPRRNVCGFVRFHALARRAANSRVWALGREPGGRPARAPERVDLGKIHLTPRQPSFSGVKVGRSGPRRGDSYPRTTRPLERAVSVVGVDVDGALFERPGTRDPAGSRPAGAALAARGDVCTRRFPSWR